MADPLPPSHRLTPRGFSGPNGSTHGNGGGGGGVIPTRSLESIFPNQRKQQQEQCPSSLSSSLKSSPARHPQPHPQQQQQQLQQHDDNDNNNNNNNNNNSLFLFNFRLPFIGTQTGDAKDNDDDDSSLFSSLNPFSRNKDKAQHRSSLSGEQRRPPSSDAFLHSVVEDNETSWCSGGSGSTTVPHATMQTLSPSAAANEPDLIPAVMWRLRRVFGQFGPEEASVSPSASSRDALLLPDPSRPRDRGDDDDFVPVNSVAHKINRQLYRYETLILHRMRPSISQFACVGLNTISSVHPKMHADELEALRKRNSLVISLHSRKERDDRPLNNELRLTSKQCTISEGGGMGFFSDHDTADIPATNTNPARAARRHRRKSTTNAVYHTKHTEIRAAEDPSLLNRVRRRIQNSDLLPSVSGSVSESDDDHDNRLSRLEAPPLQQQLTLEPLSQESHDIMVCVHGFAGGIGNWTPVWYNFIPYADVYAFDMPGFARSERHDRVFDGPLEAVEFYMGYFDRWFNAMNFDRPVYLVAHSFGAYMSCFFTMRYPHRVKKLVLLDPWGVPNYRPDGKDAAPAHMLAFLWFFYNIGGTPFSLVRVTIPERLGPTVACKIRPDYESFWAEHVGDPKIFYGYTYYCNALSVNTGEEAFKGCSVAQFCPRLPLERAFVEGVHPGTRIALIYGAQTDLDIDAGRTLCQSLQRKGCECTFESIPRAGHQVMIENCRDTARLVLAACNLGPGTTRSGSSLNQSLTSSRIGSRNNSVAVTPQTSPSGSVGR